MDPDGIERAYVPFVSLLRQGEFTAPSEGWTAEFVAAHVSRNDDLIAETAERIAAPSFHLDMHLEQLRRISAADGRWSASCLRQQSLSIPVPLVFDSW